MGRRFIITIVVAMCALGLAGCDWAQFGSGPARWRSTAEAIITPQNAGSTALKWRALGAGSSSPAVVGNRIYVGDAQHLLAFDAAGTPACDASGCVLSPLWRGDVPGTGVFASSPAVSDGIVSLGAADGRVYAFDAAGVTNCSSATGARVCQPLWTDETGGPIDNSSPAVVNGVLYIGSTDGWLYAFDAHGVSGCSGVPKACEPLWRADLGAGIHLSPTVANGQVYVGTPLGGSGLDVFDAAGVINCDGVPRVCTPLRHLVMGANVYEGPAVVGNVVYAAAGSTLYAFDATGVTNCSATTNQCQPLWRTTSGGGTFTAPAVGGGRVYVGSLGGVIDAFDAAGVQNCSGTPRICTRLGKAAIGAEIESAPAADGAGVVFFGTDDGVLYAVDGPALTTTCDSCAVLWHSTAEASMVVKSSPAIANGVVYINIGGLHAFAPG